MERIRIPNAATYLPIAPADLLLTAPIIARALFGATLPGRVLQATAVGVYAGSAALDWALRADARHIDFKAEFGVDPLDPPAASSEERTADVARLGERLNEPAAALLHRAETDPACLRGLAIQIRKLQPKFHPAREVTAWRNLLKDLKAG